MFTGWGYGRALAWDLINLINGSKIGVFFLNNRLCMSMNFLAPETSHIMALNG
jgi:hypothetical protein